MAIPERTILDIVDRTDILELISSYVHLERRGLNHFGLCPFHSEKTASFSVSPDRQLFYCFGCGAGGGAINFVMRTEGLEYADAVRFLAKRAGIEITEENTFGADRRRRLLEINREAARHFYETLVSPQGAAALSYLEGRGLSIGVVRRFGLGFAPDAWRCLTDALSRSGIEKSELLEAGLAVKGKDGGVYDRFRNRVMFPIIDLRGDVIAFGGRVMDDSVPKYLNSPETRVFSKSRTLFAMNIAKKTKRDRIILCEGYMDVIALHRSGFDCAVASLGTSLTQDQAAVIAKYKKEVVLCFDSDEAGQRAASRSLSILEKAGLSVFVASLSGAKDPDEYISRFGRDAFEKIISVSEGHVEYLFGRVLAKYDLAIDDQRIAFTREAIDMLARVSSAIERDIYASKLSALSGVGRDTIASEIASASKKLAQAEKRRRERKELSPEVSARPDSRAIEYKNLRSARAEEQVLRLMLADPEAFSVAEGELAEDDFSSPLLGRAFSEIVSGGGGRPLSHFEAVFSEPEMRHLSRILQSEPDVLFNMDALMDDILVIRTERKKRIQDSDPLLSMRESVFEKKKYI